jgi:hypothetical protein
LVLTSGVGVLQVDGVQGGADFRVKVSPAGDAEYLPANGRLRFVRWLGWSASEYTVKVTGLPEQTVRLRPWWRREKRQVPTSFFRPVLLIGADKLLVLQAGKQQLTLVVKIDGEPYTTDFDGHSVWVGCHEGDLTVPASVRSSWRDLADPAVAGKLLSPRSPPGFPAEVHPDSLVEVYLVKETDKTDIPPKKHPVLTVSRVVSVLDLVQAVQIHPD